MSDKKKNINPNGKDWRVSIIGIAILALIVFLCTALSGCGTAEPAIDFSTLDWGTYECADEVKADVGTGTVTVTPIEDYVSPTSYEAYNMIKMQVDDFVFTPGITTVADLMEHFVYEESVYSLCNAAAGMNKETFNPDRLTNETFGIVVYKHGTPYVVFNCKACSFINNDIIPAEEFVVTGFAIANISEYTSDVKYTQFADVDGYNKMAKERCWISGGIRLDGENINYKNMDELMDAQGLVRQTEGYSNQEENFYYNMTDGTYVTYTASLCCNHVFETMDSLNLTKYAVYYTVVAETQECIRVEMEIADIGAYYALGSASISAGN